MIRKTDDSHRKSPKITGQHEKMRQVEGGLQGEGLQKHAQSSMKVTADTVGEGEGCSGKILGFQLGG